MTDKQTKAATHTARCGNIGEWESKQSSAKSMVRQLDTSTRLETEENDGNVGSVEAETLNPNGRGCEPRQSPPDDDRATASILDPKNDPSSELDGLAESYGDSFKLSQIGYAQKYGTAEDVQEEIRSYWEGKERKP